jgi:glycosyltransferase involved in cell wall biosynthesis
MQSKKFVYYVIIPALNEEESIGNVIRAIQSINPKPERILVVDNGSTDQTKRVAESEGATVLQEPKRGYGNACLKAIRWIETREKSDSPEAILFMDADGSDNPLEIPDILTPIQNKAYDVCIGSRTLGNSEPGSLNPIQIFGNWLATRLLNLFFGYRFTDLGPFRAIRWRTFQDLKMQDRDFGWTIELQTKVAIQKIKCLEIPVSYRNRKAGISKVSGNWKAGFLAGKKILSVIFLTAFFHYLEILKAKRFMLFVFLFGLGLPIWSVGIYLERSEFLVYFILVSLSFLSCAYLENKFRSHNGKFRGFFKILISLSIALRIPLLFTAPNLSEDYLRYYWDVTVLESGGNPYQYTPIEREELLSIQNKGFTEIGEAPSNLIPMRNDLSWKDMNSREYISFYPTMMQIFTFISNLLPNPWKLISLKSAFIFFEIFSILILWKILPDKAKSRILFYAWNPMVILEGVGNLHFEIIMMSFFLLGAYISLLLFPNQKTKGKESHWELFLKGSFLGASVSTKLSSLVFLPGLFFLPSGLDRNLNQKKKTLSIIWILGLILVFLLPWIYYLIPVIEQQWAKGLGLYSQYFEFFSLWNPLFRSVFTYFGFSYSSSGIFIWLLSFLTIFWIFFYHLRKNLPWESFGFQAYSCILFFSPVLHPWYLIPWLVLGVLVGSRIPFVGTFLITASYSTYRVYPYQKSPEILWTSYIVFFIFTIWNYYEYKYHRNSSGSSGSINCNPS